MGAISILVAMRARAGLHNIVVTDADGRGWFAERWQFWQGRVRETGGVVNAEGGETIGLTSSTTSTATWQDAYTQPGGSAIVDAASGSLFGLVVASGSETDADYNLSSADPSCRRP